MSEVSKMMAKFGQAKALLRQGVAQLGVPNLEFELLVRSIGECKSKQEEDRIMAQEIETLKQRFAQPGLDRSRGREYMVRAIYVEMLGHDVSWAHVKAMQLASEPSIHTKKVRARAFDLDAKNAWEPYMVHAAGICIHTHTHA